MKNAFTYLIYREISLKKHLLFRIELMSHISEDAICVSVTFSLDIAKQQNVALNMEKIKNKSKF